MAFESSSSFSLSKVEPLTGSSNYHVWAMKVSAILRSKKLFKAVIEDPEPSNNGEEGSNEAKILRDTWEAKNDEAFGIIILTLSEEQAGIFVGEHKAKNVWDELKKMYAGNVEDRIIDIGLELKNIRMGHNESVDSFITKARNIASRSATLGHPIQTRELVYHIVRGLHPRFENVAAVLRSQRSLSLEEVQQCLREEESRMSGPTRGDNSRAYLAKGRHANQKRQCYVCGKGGHLAKDCWHRQGAATVEKPSRFGNKGGGKQQNNFRPKNQSQRREHHANVVKDQESKIEKAFRANEECKEDKAIDLWCLDSGCTIHMSPRLDWMTNVTPVDTEISLAEEGRCTKAEAKGNVKITTYTSDGCRQDICIYDVLYVPKLRSNLLSVKSLTNKGNTVTFDKGGAKIFSETGELIAEANEKDRMYVLESTPRKDQLRVSETNCLNVKLDIKENNPTLKINSKLLWHKRLGHLNDEYMNRMKRNEMVKGIQYDCGKLPHCEPCIMGKIVQDQFKSVENNTTKPLELIHMDLCGPMPCSSLGGARYMYVLVDSYSRRIFVYFLKSKDEAFDYFVSMANQRENELNLSVKSVRSDNGGEFINKQFEEYFKSKGIKHQRTVAYTPQSNGVAERANRTLLDKARTLLIDSQLPTEFWAEAVATAAYLKNCTPTRDAEKTPIELWNERIPSVSHLKIFGCLAYFYIPKNQRNKLEPKAKRGIFVGYSRNRKAYRIYDPEQGDIHEVRTAKFDEHQKGAILLNSKDFEPHSETHINNALEYVITTCSDFDNNCETSIPIMTEEPEQIPISTNEQEVTNDHTFEEPEVSIRQGRKKGETNELIRARHQIELMEREERLVAEGCRRSERLKDKHSANLSIDDPKFIPKNYKEAMVTHYSESWKKAMEEEIDSLNAHQVWKLTQRTKEMKVIKSKWVFNIKENPDGIIDRRKARLVAMGCNQRPGIDYEESFAPVIKMESLRTLLAIAAHFDLQIQQYDIKTAYLHGDLKETIYMEQPEGFVAKGDENKVCELQRSLYGLPQSGRCWNQKLDEILRDLELEPLKSDPCIYKLQKGEIFCLLGIYVDDILAVGTDNIISDVIEKLKKHVTVTQTTCGSFLGIEINKTSGGISVNQGKYIDKILVKFGLNECKPVKTPCAQNQDLDVYQESEPTDRGEYLELIGSLMYLSVGSRPDITFCVSNLSQYSNDPRKIHLTAVKRVFRYLKGTRDYRLFYNNQMGELKASSDASWCSTRDAKSFSGYTIKLGDSLVAWKAKKQDLVALSTFEAELIAACEGIREVQWMRNLLSELGFPQYVQLPVTVYTDSKSLIDWVKGNNNTFRTKHISRKFHFVRDEVVNGNVILKFVPSEEMEADLLTKGLCTEKLNACNSRLQLKV